MDFTAMAVGYPAVLIAILLTVYRLRVSTASRFVLSLILVSLAPITVFILADADPSEDGGGLPHVLWWFLLLAGFFAMVLALCVEIVIERWRQ